MKPNLESHCIIEEEMEDFEMEHKAETLLKNDLEAAFIYYHDFFKSNDLPEPTDEHLSYLYDLIKKSFDQVPAILRDDPDFFARILLCLDNPRECEKGVLFSLLPTELKANPIFLDKLVILHGGAFKSLLLHLSAEDERAIPTEWYQIFFDKEMSLPNWQCFNSQLLKLLENYGARTIPWKLLSEEQQKETMEQYFDHPLASDFEVLPHRILPGAVWHLRVQSSFNWTCETLSHNQDTNDYYDNGDETVIEKFSKRLVELSKWPELYRKGLEYDRQMLKKIIFETGFLYEVIKAIKELTGETPESLNLKEEIYQMLDYEILYGNYERAGELIEYLPSDEHEYYQDFLDFQSEYGFDAREIQAVWDMWKKKNSVGSHSSEHNEEIAQKIIRRIYPKHNSEEPNILKVQEHYQRYAALIPDSDKIFWRYFGRLDRKRAARALNRFLDLLEENEHHQGLGLRSRAVILESLLRKIKIPEDAESTAELFEKITLEQVEHLSTHQDDLDSYTLRAEIFAENFFAEYGKTIEVLSMNTFNFQRASMEMRGMRKKIHSARKIGALGAKEMDTLQKRFQEQSARLREAQNLERRAIVDLASLARETMERTPTLSADVLKQYLFQELGFDACFTLETKRLVEKALNKYVARFQAVRKYAHQYEHDPDVLFRLAAPERVRKNPTKKPIKMCVKGVSLIFELENDDYNIACSGYNIKKSAGVALYDASIRELSGSLVLMRAGYDSTFREEIMTHEDRHQEDKFFFKFTSDSERAKTEILAYFTEGQKPGEIKNMLTDKEGLYYYPSVQSEEAWKQHCARVSRAVDIAFKVNNVDLLATTPMSQWAKLLVRPSVVAQAA